MEAVEYEVLYRREEDYWYFLGLRDLVADSLARLFRGRKDLAVLDTGCGTGKLLEALDAHRPWGLELSAEAFPWLRRRDLSKVVRASICQMPFPDESFDVVLCMDVLPCVEAPGDAEAVREMARVQKRGGVLLLHAAAYNFLYSRHDLATHTKQRYTRGRLGRLIDQAGLRIETISYHNTTLFPIAALVRGAQKLLAANPVAPRSDLKPLPRLLNRALTLPLLFENRLIRLGVRLPFGLSIFCVARKPAASPAQARGRGSSAAAAVPCGR
jgi:SAM-dependent methyltransferase